MKNLMYGVITVVVILVGSVFVWSKIQDQKLKEASFELQQEQITDKEKVEDQEIVETEEIDKEADTMVSEEEYINNTRKYFNALKDDYFKITTNLDGLSVDERREQVNLVIQDTENFIELEPPNLYRSQHNQIIDIVKDMREVAIVAIDEKDSLSIALKFADTELVDNIVILRDIIDSLPSPAQSSDVNENHQSIYYENCTDAGIQGATPVYSDDPGYTSALDRDGDGVGCE